MLLVGVLPAMQECVFLTDTRSFITKGIAKQCGFSDIAYFRMVFKKKIGKNITEYLSDKKTVRYR